VIDYLADPTPAECQSIIAPLNEHARARGHIWQPSEFALALRDDAGEIRGGVIGEVHWGWLRVKILAVEEAFRGQGWGSQLLGDAEQIGTNAGCRYAWVDTYSFQARPFYEKRGYRVFGELPDFPAGQTRYFLSKVLRDESAAPAWGDTNIVPQDSGMPIDHVELFVPDRREAATWYKQVLGLTILPGLEHWADDPRGPLMISGDNGKTKLALFTGEPQRERATAGFHLVAFRVGPREWEAFHARVGRHPVFDERGQPVTALPIRDHGQAHSVYFSDPYGHRLEVTMYRTDDKAP
jgi:GNAT superfamily N-acetyltransferase/catechol 2,3-dioxygenase-like lactoylglutathione lyase family enzyme